MRKENKQKMRYSVQFKSVALQLRTFWDDAKHEGEELLVCDVACSQVLILFGQSCDQVVL